MGFVSKGANQSAQEADNYDVIDLDDDESSIFEDEDDHLKMLIQKVFNVFDQNGDGTIDASDIGNVYRCLLLNISQAQLEEIEAQLPKCDENSVSCDLLMPRLLSMLQTNDEKQKLPSDELLETACMALIAADGCGTQSSVKTGVTSGEALTKNNFITLLTTHGEVLTENEVNEMLSHLSIRKNNIVDWRAYIRNIRLAINEQKNLNKVKN